MSDQSSLFIVECLNVSEAEKKEEGVNSAEIQDENGGNKEKKEKNEEKNAKTKEKKNKAKSSKEMASGIKKSSKKKEKTKPSKEDDSEKIKRLIRQQANEQSREGQRKRNKKYVGGRMDERKRRELQMRLREIDDVDRLRRELRKIRTKEMTEDDYAEMEPWERDLDSRIPDEVRRDMRRRRFERMEDAEDLRRELRMRIIDLEDNDGDDDGYFLGQNSFVFRELSQRYMMEAEEIRDPSELKKRIDDLDALSTIFHGGRGRDRWRDRHRRRHRDEL